MKKRPGENIDWKVQLQNNSILHPETQTLSPKPPPTLNPKVAWLEPVKDASPLLRSSHRGTAPNHRIYSL